MWDRKDKTEGEPGHVNVAAAKVSVVEATAKEEVGS